MGSESVCHLQQDTHFPHLHSSPSLYTHACTTRTGFFFFFFCLGLGCAECLVCIRSRSLCVVQTGGVGARLGFLRGNYCQRGSRGRFARRHTRQMSWGGGTKQTNKQTTKKKKNACCDHANNTVFKRYFSQDTTWNHKKWSV